MDESKKDQIGELKEELRKGRISRREFVRMMTAVGISASALCIMSDRSSAKESKKGGRTSQPEAKAGYTIIVDPVKCTGCLACAVACAEKYMKEVAPEEAKNTINLEFSRIRPMRFQYVDFINICQYCELIMWAEGSDKHPCEAVCPTKAIHPVPEGEGKPGLTGMGYLTVDRDKCLGVDSCGRCLEICEEQFGSGISFDPIERKAQICTRCGGDPACVKACPENALEFKPVLVNGRYYAHTPDQAAELLYRKMYNVKRDL